MLVYPCRFVLIALRTATVVRYKSKYCKRLIDTSIRASIDTSSRLEVSSSGAIMTMHRHVR